MTEYGDEFGGSEYRIVRDDAKIWTEARVGRGDKITCSVHCDVTVYEGPPGFKCLEKNVSFVVIRVYEPFSLFHLGVLI